MKSIKAKAKSRKATRFGRVKFPSKDTTTIPPDLSQLRRPIDTSISTFYQASRILEDGTDEVRSFLAYECDLVYECRICRSLFRSLVNFISHKRVYCKEKFDVTNVKSISYNCETNISMQALPNSLEVENAEETCQESLSNNRILRSQALKEEPKKDLSAIVDMLQRKQLENLRADKEQLFLETAKSNPSAVYQTVDSTEHGVDLMEAQVTELECMVRKQTAVLGSDGRLIEANEEQKNSNMVEVRNSQETEVLSGRSLVCSICSTQFATRKTLAFHMRTLHTSHRLCYPCPCCTSTFTNTWSVYRHLFKVHRKSNEQVRKLRSQIQEKAFRKNRIAAEDLKRKHSINSTGNTELRINETQEWMDHLESDTELQRCGGCGKRFDRKAALSSHSQYCQMRVAAYKATKMKKTSKTPLDNLSKSSTNSEVQTEQLDIVNSFPSEVNDSNETSIRVEAVASLSKADWDMLENGGEIPLTNEVNHHMEKTNSIQNYSTSDISDPPEIIYSSISKPQTVRNKRKRDKDNIKKLVNGKDIILDEILPDVPSQKNKDAEQVDYALLMEEKMTSIANVEKLQCLPCKQRFTSVNNLRRHVAIHIGWNRYRCKLCDFKCFVKCDCVAHCNKAHNAQNNRTIISEMIAQIPDKENTYDEEIILDVANIEQELCAPELAEVIIPMEGSEIERKASSEKEGEKSVLQEVIRENGEMLEQSDHRSSESKDVELPSAGLDPDLRRMVMEVIFGSCDGDSSKDIESKEPHSPAESNSKIHYKKKTISGSSDARESEVTFTQDAPKLQRPVRNRIKPLSKDFIYDLKDVVNRKDAIILKPFGKPLAKRSPQEEYEQDKATEQPTSKKFKSVANDSVSILCESRVIENFNVRLPV